jgi:hypothetical protein
LFSAFKTSEKTKEDPEPADEGDIQMEYSLAWFFNPSIGAVTKNYVKNSGYHLIIQNIQQFITCPVLCKLD